MTIKHDSGITGSVTGANARTLSGPTNGRLAKLAWKGSDGKTGNAILRFTADGKSFKGTWDITKIILTAENGPERRNSLIINSKKPRQY